MKQIACIIVGILLTASPTFAGNRINGRVMKRGPTDPAKIACADKLGVQFDYSVNHYTGSPAVMSAWKRCVNGGG